LIGAGTKFESEALLILLCFGPVANFVIGCLGGARRRPGLVVEGVLATILGLVVLVCVFGREFWPSDPTDGEEWMGVVFVGGSLGISIIVAPIAYAIARYLQSVFTPTAESRLKCASCGYSLVGLARAKCPECGKPFDATILAMNAPPPAGSGSD